MYKYYKPVEREEHMLYGFEVAKVAEVYSSTGKLHEKFIIATLNDIENELGTEKLYYNTKSGLKRVYPHEVWSGALDLINSTKDTFIDTHSSVFVDVNGKRFNIYFNKVKVK